MKYAKSMKYGGELVSAADCNYTSYLELGLLCPECSEPVYKRAEGDRISPLGKPFKVGAHFCHRKAVSEEQAAMCEQRVNSYTEEEKQRIAAKARGQRLKLLQRWFWEAFEKTMLENAFNGDLGFIARANNINANLQKDIFLEVIADIRDFAGVKKEIMPQSPSRGMHTIDYVGIRRLMPVDKPYLDMWPNDVPLEKRRILGLPLQGIVHKVVAFYFSAGKKSGSLKDYLEMFGKSSQIGIYKEVLEFLFAKQNRELLRKVLCCALVVIGDSGRGLWFSSQVAAGYEAENMIVSMIQMIIAEGDWYFEFQRLEAKLKAKGKAA